MILSTSSLLSFLLLATPASSSTLRSGSDTHQDRRLSFELIASYEPYTQVTDMNAIDLDQASMEDQLAIRDPTSWKRAEDIYTYGGNSKSVAMITLSSPLTSSLKKFTAASGKNADGAVVYGTVYDDYPNGATTIGIQYKTTDIQASYVECQVGGLVKKTLKGCLAPSGSISLDGNVLEYTYNPETENVNKRTLKKLSSDAEQKMFRCEHCPSPTFRKFFDYYGFFDYADKWVSAAFKGKSTSLAKGNGAFGLYGYVGRDEAIKKGTAYLSIWMWVIKQMEDAFFECDSECTTDNCNNRAQRAWDEAVASYTGSLEGVDGTGSGKLLYALADKRCKDFKTCGSLANSAEGTSHVNIEVIRSFALGSRLLAQGKCAEVKPYTERIVQLMSVPLIQGTLRYAYITSNNPSSGDKAEVEGATFAASILPLVDACDEDAADIIYKNMKTGQAKTADFAKVKAALESVYGCMGVDGRNVGGIWNADTGKYLTGAKPARGSYSRAASSVNVPLIVGCVAGGLVLGVILYLFASKCCNRSKLPPVEKEDPLGLSEDDEQVADTSQPVVHEEDPLPSTNSEMEPVEIS